MGHRVCGLDQPLHRAFQPTHLAVPAINNDHHALTETQVIEGFGVHLDMHLEVAGTLQRQQLLTRCRKLAGINELVYHNTGEGRADLCVAQLCVGLRQSCHGRSMIALCDLIPGLDLLKLLLGYGLLGVQGLVAVKLRASFGQGGLGLSHRRTRLVDAAPHVRRVQRQQQLPLGDLLPLMDMHLLHIAHEARRDLHLIGGGNAARKAGVDGQRLLPHGLHLGAYCASATSCLLRRGRPHHRHSARQ